MVLEKNVSVLLEGTFKDTEREKLKIYVAYTSIVFVTFSKNLHGAIGGRPGVFG